ncbi:hypothetical protein GCM10009710_09960 [Aeromicrobium alkaliterrae]|uniref:DUF2157 domain-containing protein n=1 Tax=Aeromicrobium alkaliterrae TaxID=302168 RepID=A0ABN2JLA9_9ACTN
MCGFDVRSPEVAEIWSHLEQIDELVATARARAVPVAPPVAAPVAPAVPPPPTQAVGPPPMPGVPPVTGAPAAGGGLSAGSVLLGLGATLLVVAAIIFVSFAWSAMGIGGRAAILAVLTVGVGGAGSWSLARRLRGSSEALWLVFVGFVSADWFAACGLGLFGLDGLEGWQVAVPWWVLMSLTTVVVGTVARRVADHSVVSLEVVAGLALVPVVATVGSALGEQDVRLFWVMAILTLLAAAVATGAVLLSQKVWAAVSGVVAGACGVVTTVAAVVEAAAHRDLDAYVGQVHGLPLLLVTVAAACLAVRRELRAVGVAAGVLLLALLVGLPLVDPLDGQAWLVWVAALAALVMVLRLPASVGVSQVGTGLVVAGGVLSAPLIVAWLAGLAPLGTIVDAAARGPRDRPLLADTPGLGQVETLHGWITVVVGAGLATMLVAAGRGRGSTPALRRAGDLTAALVVLATAAAVLVAAGVPLVVLAAVTLAAGVVLLVVGRRAGLGWEAVGLAVVVLSPLVATAVWNGILVVAAAAVVVLVVHAVVSTRSDLTVVSTPAAGLWILASSLLLVTHPDIDLGARPAISILLAVALVMAVVGTGLVQPPLGWSPGVTLEGVGSAVALVLLLSGVALGDLAWLSAWLTAVGVTAMGVGLIVPGRRWVRIPAAVLLGLAWILRLAASEVTQVEAYTVPFAVAALLVGWIALRRDPELSTTVALGSGFVLGLLPTALVVLTDPVSIRAAVLGAVAAAFLAAGLALRWQAPFVAGGAALALVAIVELAPYGWGLPRWVLIGVAGLVLLVGGITWENRVRDGRAAVRFVRSMR